MIAAARRRTYAPSKTGSGLLVPKYVSDVLSTPSLLAYYRLQETSGTVAADSSGNGYNATITGSPTLGLTGPLSNGGTDLAMGGWSSSNFITLPSGLSVKDNQSLTIEMFYDLTGGPGGQWTGFVFGAPLSTGNRIQAHMPFQSTVYFDDGNFNSGGRVSSAWNAAWSNTWTHFAFVADATAGKLTIYVNGTQQVQGAWTTQNETFTGGQIGYWTGANLWAGGPLAEFAVYSAALSQSTIQQHYGDR